jgi:hypothetical protein
VLIETMPQVLAWEAADDVCSRVFRAYVELLSDSLGSLLYRMRDADSSLAQRLELALAGASDDALMRVLTAPETSFRLLWKGDASDHARAEFILASFDAEAIREGHAARPAVEVWTALGDTGFLADGTTLTWAVEGLMPLDFGSPRLRSVVIDEVGLPDGGWGMLSEQEIVTVQQKLREARMGIELTGAHLLDLVCLFNRVLVCFRDSAIPHGSSSGSTGQYVGRSFLTNPHLPGVDNVMVAEALVHEAIHGLLYMQERRKAWVPEALYTGAASGVVSPWSGNRLPLRQYLQACFVWYGLLHFWCLALLSGSFPQTRVHTRIAQALIGYLGAPLTQALGPERADVSAEILDAIDEMQDRARSSFTDVAPEALTVLTVLQ